MSYKWSVWVVTHFEYLILRAVSSLCLCYSNDDIYSSAEIFVYILTFHVNKPIFLSLVIKISEFVDSWKETAELHIFTNRDLLHKKSWSNFVIDIFHGQTLALVHETCWPTSENFFSPWIVKKFNLVHLASARFLPRLGIFCSPPLRGGRAKKYIFEISIT